MIEENNIEVDRIAMSSSSEEKFTTGKEKIEIIIDNSLEAGKFIYLRPGQEYNHTSNNVIEYMFEWGGRDFFKEKLFSQKREDWPNNL